MLERIKCDACGKFISDKDIASGDAYFKIIQLGPDPFHPSIEYGYEAECPSCLAPLP